MDFQRLKTLNFHHLLYFEAVVQERSISRAAELLQVSQPTMSAQIKRLEAELKRALFKRQGRGVVLTSFGQRLHERASRVFRESERLLDTLDSALEEGHSLVVGVVDAVPKLLSRHLLDALFMFEPTPHLTFHENKLEDLLAELTLERCDVVLSDSPMGPQHAVRAFNHELGSSPISLFGTRELIEQWSAEFPRDLEGAPFLLPGEGSSLRRSLDQWLNETRVHPRVVAECDDQALAKAFASEGRGFFVGPSLMAQELQERNGMHEVLRLDGQKETFYAITTQRRLRDPLLISLSTKAKDILN